MVTSTDILVEALLPSGAAVGAAHKDGGDGKPENTKKWLRNKLKGLARLLGKLGAKWQKHCLASLGQLSAGSSIG